MQLKRLFVGYLLVLLAGFTGCATKMGPNSVRPDRANYNQAIVDSGNEQLLLNLVRLRYRDRPMFLELQSVVSQRSLQGNLSGGMTIGVDGSSKNEGVVGASAGFEEKPTVTYTPLQGADFARRILTPLTPETIILLSNSGWSIERLFLTCVSRLNGVENASSASGPTPRDPPVFEEFHELATALRGLQKSGLLTLQAFRTPKEELPQIEVIINFPPGVATNAEVGRIQKRLNLTPGEHHLKLTTALKPSQENEFALHTRSLMAVFYYLSQGVESPAEHEQEGLVTVTRDSAGNRFDWSRVLGNVFKVHTQRTKPEHAAVAVRHRGYWFYIDDTDLDSKSTFNLLHFLLSLQAGGDAGKAPLLTLPTG